MDGKGLEAHLQTVEQRSHGAGTCHVDLIIPLQHFQKPGIDHLGIQALKGQEQDAECRGVRRLHVFLADVFCLAAENELQRVAGVLHGSSIAGSLGVL